jgi:CBS domain-containing protein
MSIKSILDSKSHSILSLLETESVLSAVKKMADAGVGSIIVLDGEELAGIFTERDLLKVCAKDHLKLDTILLKDVMTKNLTVANSEDSVDDVLGMMISKKFRHMPVLEGSKILGLISIGDAVKDKMDKAVAEANILRQYIHGS